MGSMNEYYTPAVVLDRRVKNAKDLQVTLYTKELGKISAIAKSMRKITSKLAGHMQIGNVVDVRVIDRGSFQLIDGLSRKSACKDEEVLRFLSFIDAMTTYHQVDIRLWYTLNEVMDRCQFSPAVYRYFLQIMGFGQEVKEDSTVCGRCRKDKQGLVYFYAPDIIFLCSSCLQGTSIDKHDLVPIS